MAIPLRRVTLLSLVLTFSSTGYATTDCQRAEDLDVASHSRRIVAYRDAAPPSVDADIDVRRSIEREVQGKALLDYMDSLGVARRTTLEFMICESERKTTTLTTQQDIKNFNRYGVAVAMWRTSETGEEAIAYLVIPHLLRVGSTVNSDHAVVARASASTNKALQVWVERTGASNSAMAFLLGFGLGTYYLDAGESPLAKLALCKSRKDLKRTLTSLLRPTKPAAELGALLDKLVQEADQKMTAAGAPLDDRLAKSIRVACAP